MLQVQSHRTATARAWEAESGGKFSFSSNVPVAPSTDETYIMPDGKGELFKEIILILAEFEG